MKRKTASKERRKKSAHSSFFNPPNNKYHAQIRMAELITHQKLQFGKTFFEKLQKASNLPSQSRYIQLAQETISPAIQKIEDIIEGIEKIQGTLLFEPLWITPQNDEKTEIKLATNQGEIKLENSFFQYSAEQQTEFLINAAADLNMLEQRFSAFGSETQQTTEDLDQNKGWAAYINTLIQVPHEQLSTHVNDVNVQIDKDLGSEDPTENEDDSPVEPPTDENNENNEVIRNTRLPQPISNELSFLQHIWRFLKNLFSSGA